MREISVTITDNDLIGRLRTAQERMTDDNFHDWAFLVGLAIQAIKQEDGSRLKVLEERLNALADTVDKMTKQANTARYGS